MSYIETAVEGSLGSLPVERHTQTGKRYVTLAIVVREKGSDDAEWVNVSAFEAVADEVPGDLAKGERLYVEGRARLSRWTTKDGQARVNLQVTAFRLLVLDRIGRKRRKTEALPRNAEKPANGRSDKARRWQAPLDVNARRDELIPF